MTKAFYCHFLYDKKVHLPQMQNVFLISTMSSNHSSYEGGQLGVFHDNGMVEQLTERFGANRFLYAL
jgi:ribosomal protein L31